MTKKERIEEAIALLKDAVNIIEDCKSKEEPQFTYEEIKQDQLTKVFDYIVDELAKATNFNDEFLSNDVLDLAIEISFTNHLFVNTGGENIVKIPELISTIQDLFVESLDYAGYKIVKK